MPTGVKDSHSRTRTSPPSWLRWSRATHAVRRWLPAKSSRSRRAQSVERADDARPIVSRRKRMRERRLGTPAGTVPRRDDTRPDTIGEVVDGRLDVSVNVLRRHAVSFTQPAPKARRIVARTRTDH